MIVLIRVKMGDDFIEKKITETNLLKLYVSKDKNKLPFTIEIVNEFEADDDYPEIEHFINQKKLTNDSRRNSVRNRRP